MVSPTSIYKKKLVDSFAPTSREVWTKVGGLDPPIPPMAMPLYESLDMKQHAKEKLCEYLVGQLL